MKVPRPMLSMIALLAIGTSAQAQDPVGQGQRLVAEFCASCHAVGPRGRSRHRGAPPFRTLGRSVDLDELPRALEQGITSGHPDMPDFKFTHDDALAVRAYLRVIQQ